MKTEKVAGNY